MKEDVYCYEKRGVKYPQRLREQLHMPEKLFVTGSLPEEQIPTVAVVGARMCSQYGRMQAFEFSKALAQCGVQVISGLARGIDGCAHAGALAGGGRTFAVLGCGVDICYPKENKKLYDEIKNNGGVLSEFPLGTKPFPKHFPMRNRIISALADVVLVIEAKLRSGSLITVDFALEQGKTVFALPGRVGDQLSAGCNRLISQGAGIAWSVNSVLEELGLEQNFSPKADKKRGIGLATVKDLVYSCVDLTPKDLNVILEEIPYSAQEISTALLELLLEGKILEPFKNYYVRAVN